MGWVVNAKPRPLYPRERSGTHCLGGWVGPRAGLDRCGKSHPHRDSIPGPFSPQRVDIATTISRPIIIIIIIVVALFASKARSQTHEHSGCGGFLCRCKHVRKFIYVYNGLVYIFCVYTYIITHKCKKCLCQDQKINTLNYTMGPEHCTKHLACTHIFENELFPTKVV